MQSNYITGQREPGETSAAEWGERPRETVTVMPVYPAKSDTQYAAPRHRHLRSRSCCEIASPGCFWRPGDFLSRQYCLMLYDIKHDTLFKPLGRGRTADLSRPAFQEKRIPTPVCALARNDTQILSASVIARAHRARGNPPLPSPRPPCLKGAGHGEAVTGGFFFPTAPAGHAGPALQSVALSGVGGQGRPPLPTRSRNA